MTHYKALQVSEGPDKTFLKSIVTLNTADLPAGDLLIRVRYSSLNYKDALSASGHRGITRNYPHTPGIDASGVVEHSAVEHFKPGDEVIVIGYDLGANTPGGLGQYISVPAQWAVPKPQGLSLRDAMIIGTAGFTVAQCLDKLEHMGLKAGQRVVVSGATGGVGSFAVALLNKVGCEVVASTGSPDHTGFLKSLGASDIISRSQLAEPDTSPLGKEQWHAAVDTAGGYTLANIIRGLRREGSVASVGLVESADLPANVMPFILRGVHLLGINSADIELTKRIEIWQRLATDWKLDNPEALATEISLEQAIEVLGQLLQGKTRGRIIVVHEATN